MDIVKKCRPCGSQILLELLTAQEMLGTKLIVNETKTMKEFQAIILGIGPLVSDTYGFKLGDRVLISGNGTPVPNYDGSERDKVLMEPSAIKAVLS
jgi:co-chaperonin GroES (HSP10)